LQATNQPLPAPAALQKKAIDKAIGELLQLQVAQRAGLKVSDKDVERVINQIAQQNHFSVDQLKDAIEKQGMNFAHYRTQIHDQMLMQQVQQQALGGKVHVSNADVQAYLKKFSNPNADQAQYRLDDLLIPLKEDATSDEVDQATKQAGELAKKARAGADFKDLVKPPVQNIDLQWRTLKDLPSVFVDAVSRLKTGDVTDPIKAPNGIHLLRLIDARGHTPALTETEAKQRAYQQKLQEEADKWAVELRKAAYVKIM
jgi:peptidyl-prolyl cis-trans isomerase SurA